MIFEILFNLARIALIAWVLMVLFPRARITRLLIGEGIFPLYLCVLYAIGVFALIAEMVSAQFFVITFQFSSIDIVRAVFANPDAAVVLWLHILAFDQVVGMYIYEDNMANRYISLRVQSLVLVLTLFVGPIGFLLYLLLRAPKRRAMRVKPFPSLA